MYNCLAQGATLREHSRTHPRYPTSAADAKAAVQKARQVAAEFEHNNGYAIPVAYLAKKIADENQIHTQVSGTPPPSLLDAVATALSVQ